MIKIEILLSVFNGEKYLIELFESLLSQTYRNFRILIRNDFSTDNSINIIKKYTKNYPDTFRLFHDSLGKSGTVNSFMHLLENTETDYLMFCDQDDIWKNNKVQSTFDKMRITEEIYPSLPILIHTDLEIVNSELESINSSLWKYQKINPKRTKLHQIIVQNIGTGCTMMINKPLIKIVHPVPDGIIMHDWWFMLVASTFGKIDYISESTVCYRQHELNQIGAKEYGRNKIIQRLKSLSVRAVENNYIKKQILAFKQRYKDDMPLDKKEIVDKFLEINNYGFIKKRFAYFINGFKKNGILRNLADIIFPI
jgi:glycosyltransferase involved in cell wall biosynthesis